MPMSASTARASKTGSARACPRRRPDRVVSGGGQAAPATVTSPASPAPGHHRPPGSAKNVGGWGTTSPPLPPPPLTNWPRPQSTPAVAASEARAAVAASEARAAVAASEARADEDGFGGQVHAERLPHAVGDLPGQGEQA